MAPGTHPFGAQSLNGGLHEVYELVERMAACTLGHRSLATLELWRAAREREWSKLLGMAGAPEVQPGAASWLHGRAQRLVPALPASGRDLDYVLGELGISLR